MVTAKPTNALLICTDQQQAGALSATGCPWLNTPAMDSLATGGTRFSSDYCLLPICLPSHAVGLFAKSCKQHASICVTGQGRAKTIFSHPFNLNNFIL